MLQVLCKAREQELAELKENQSKWGTLNHDVTIRNKTEEITIDKDGIKTIKPIYKEENLTRRINATEKLLKKQTAEEKLEEIKKAFMNNK